MKTFEDYIKRLMYGKKKEHPLLEGFRMIDDKFNAKPTMQNIVLDVIKQFTYNLNL